MTVSTANPCDVINESVSASARVFINATSGSCRPSTYPNPANATLTIERPTDADPTNDTDPLSIRLLDSMSQVRGSATLTNAPQVLDTSALPAGIYYLHIDNGTQVVTREQIQVE